MRFQTFSLMQRHQRIDEALRQERTRKRPDALRLAWLAFQKRRLKGQLLLAH